MDDSLSAEDAYLVHRINLAERFGWTFGEIDSMDTWEFWQTMMILDAKDRGAAYRNRPKGK